jgi:hypothetical protein
MACRIDHACLVTVKTGPSITDAAMTRVSQTTKVIAEGGYEKIFHQTFDVAPGEKLKKPYACYLSTSAGPVMGVLYLSTVKLAFCSDNPLSYMVGDKTEWSYYKLIYFCCPLFCLYADVLLKLLGSAKLALLDIEMQFKLKPISLP